MKTLFYVIILSTLLSSCGLGSPKDYNSVQKGEVSVSKYRTIDYDTVLIDSCEYVITPVYCGYSIAHKGNCRYCRSRKN